MELATAGHAAKEFSSTIGGAMGYREMKAVRDDLSYLQGRIYRLCEQAEALEQVMAATIEKYKQRRKVRS